MELNSPQHHGIWLSNAKARVPGRTMIPAKRNSSAQVSVGVLSNLVRPPRSPDSISLLVGMASVVYLASRAPSKLTDDLMLAGHRAWECLSVSEVLYICEQEWIDAVVIAPEVEEPDVVEAQLRHITIRLKPQATAKYLIWELDQLFPSKSSIH